VTPPPRPRQGPAGSLWTGTKGPRAKIDADPGRQDSKWLTTSTVIPERPAPSAPEARKSQAPAPAAFPFHRTIDARNLGGRHHTAASGSLRVPRVSAVAGQRPTPRSVPSPSGIGLAVADLGVRPHSTIGVIDTRSWPPGRRRPAVLLRRCTSGTEAAQSPRIDPGERAADRINHSTPVRPAPRRRMAAANHQLCEDKGIRGASASNGPPAGPKPAPRRRARPRQAGPSAPQHH